MNDSDQIQRALDRQEQEHTKGLSDERERELEQEPCECLLPKSTREALDRYVNQRIETGGFLRSVLENDFSLAVARADPANFAVLKQINDHIRHCVPGNCHGSKQAVSDWLKEGVKRW